MQETHSCTLKRETPGRNSSCQYELIPEIVRQKILPILLVGIGKKELIKTSVDHCLTIYLEDNLH